MDQGKTSIDNLLLLCHGHHVAVHEGGFSVALEEGEREGEPVFRDPRGRVIAPAPEPPRLRGDAMASLERQQKIDGILIDRRTSLPLWDGSSLDLGSAVER